MNMIIVKVKKRIDVYSLGVENGIWLKVNIVIIVE